MKAQDALAEARSLYESAALGEAKAAFESALRSGELDPAGLASAHWHLAVLAAMSGDDARARDAYLVAHAIDPSFVAPDELPPDRRDAFRDPGTDPLALGTTRRQSDDQLTLIVTFERAPRALVARFRSDLDDAVRERGAQLEIRREAFEGDEITIRIEGLDQYGNVSIREDVVIERPASWATSPIEVAPAPPPSRSRRGLRVGLGVTAALLVVGAVVTGVMLSRRDDGVEFAQPVFERQ